MKSLPTIFVLSLMLIGHSLISQRVLVISGGGARGAWGGGVIEHLVNDKDYDYNAIVATSTGSLMAPLVSIEDFNTLREMYTGVNQRSIFNVNPFRTKKRDGKVVAIKPKFLKAIFRIIFGKKTLGESKNLRKLILHTYDRQKYENILSQGDQFFVTVTNFSSGDVFYFDSQQELFNSRTISCEGLQGRNLRDCLKEKDEKRTALLDWIWRSANQPLFMTLNCTDGVIMDGENHSSDERNCWVDGGVRENIPLLKGIEYVLDNNPECSGAPTIDVVINNRPQISLDTLKKRRILNSLFRTIGILTYDVRDNDINLPAEMEKAYQLEMVKSGQTYSDDHPYIKVNLYFMPDEVYTRHPWDLYFNKTSMGQLWDAGKSEGFVHIPLQLSREVAQLLVTQGKASKQLY